MAIKLICEFLDVTLSADAIVSIARVEMVQAPEKGEFININGDPYRVIERRWVVSKIDGDQNTFCYFDVMRWKND